MSFIENLKDTVSQIKQGEAGQRFVQYYEYRKQREQDSLGKNVAMWALGIGLTGVGVFGALLPILPGFLFFIPGIAILAARSRYLARGLDQIERGIRKLKRKASQTKDPES